MEAIAIRVEAIAIRLEAIALRLEAIALRRLRTVASDWGSCQVSPRVCGKEGSLPPERQVFRLGHAGEAHAGSRGGGSCSIQKTKSKLRGQWHNVA